MKSSLPKNEIYPPSAPPPYEQSSAPPSSGPQVLGSLPPTVPYGPPPLGPQVIPMYAPPQPVAPTTITTVHVEGGGGYGHLPPGTCTVCRKGRIENSASCCTWLMCLLCFPIGIIPGVIAFFCCCRKPKCTHCGFSC